MTHAGCFHSKKVWARSYDSSRAQLRFDAEALLELGDKPKNFVPCVLMLLRRHTTLLSNATGTLIFEDRGDNALHRFQSLAGNYKLGRPHTKLALCLIYRLRFAGRVTSRRPGSGAPVAGSTIYYMCSIEDRWSLVACARSRHEVLFTRPSASPPAEPITMPTSLHRIPVHRHRHSSAEHRSRP
ncbi:hypothetical protein BD413DRAFT_271467 [Trametes elegans]|nr:hypothetical protein BD413DRAFT_271467 [Trametes elegans]